MSENDLKVIVKAKELAVHSFNTKLIVGSVSRQSEPETLGRYATTEEAKGVLRDMLSALQRGDAVFEMPLSIIVARETIIKDARTVRKGGS